jgi:radical SAM-linked protein
MPSIERDPVSARYRVRVSRLGPARLLTHLAQIEALRRAVQLTGLPTLMDARRKRPRPKLSFGPAISVGYESLAEYFDMELESAHAPAKIATALGATLEDGFQVKDARRIPAFFPSLEASINVVRYEIEGPFPDGAEDRLKSFLGRKDIIIEKLKQGGARLERVDARPLILQMRFLAPGRVGLTLRFGPKRTVKPEAIVRDWLGLPAPRVPVGAAGPSPEARPEPLEGFTILRKDLFSETAGGELLTP